MSQLFKFNHEQIEIQELEVSKNLVSFKMKGVNYKFELIGQRLKGLLIRDEHHVFYSCVESMNKAGTTLSVENETYILKELEEDATIENEDVSNTLISPMPGRVLKVKVKEGQIVEEGDVLLIVEAMKMEHAIKAPLKGEVQKLMCVENDLVVGGAELIEMNYDKRD